MTSRSVTLTGRNNTQPRYMTDLQRENAEAPWAEEGGGVRGIVLAAVVAVPLWAAFFAAVLS